MCPREPCAPRRGHSPGEQPKQLVSHERFAIPAEAWGRGGKGRIGDTRLAMAGVTPGNRRSLSSWSGDSRINNKWDRQSIYRCSHIY